MILPPICDSAALIIGDKGVQGVSICWAVSSFLKDYFCIRPPSRPNFNNNLSFFRGISHFFPSLHVWLYRQSSLEIVRHYLRIVISLILRISVVIALDILGVALDLTYFVSISKRSFSTARSSSSISNGLSNTMSAFASVPKEL